MGNGARNETEIFKDLEKLCTSAGYAHIIAFFCHRDNIIRYADEISVDDVIHQFSMERLVRTEISTLIGLMYKQKIDLSIPKPETFQKHIDETKALLKELQHSIVAGFSTKTSKEGFNPLTTGAALREAIFYGAESAYYFQYREFSVKKYSKHNTWFISNKGYSIEDACAVLTAITEFQNKNFIKRLTQIMKKHPDEWTMLPLFMFTVDDIHSESGVEIAVIKAVIDSFVPPDGIKNEEFSTLSDFNITNAYPIIPLSDSNYLLFQIYSLAEALYETPFFWRKDEKNFSNHRGGFAEEFSAERLKLVFGSDKVFTNIEIGSKKRKKGEIDVLVAFSNRAIILQAKSKRLQIPARKGNDNCIRDDFKKAIQESYDQGLKCSKLLTDEKYKLFDSESNELKINRKFKEIYILCVVSDHYPALSFQAHGFLKYETTDIIMSPFVMDIFLLDVMTEMLQTPLYFLSYINRRTEYAEKIGATHELTILSYHLKQNLFMVDGYDFLFLGDDIRADLDLAMLVRREGVPGQATPDGILTKNKNTVIGQIIREIERLEHPATIDFGFMLLRLGEETIENIIENIQKIANLANKDNKHHDLTYIGKNDMGFTIHCNRDAFLVSETRLKEHCERRKYSEKARNWFGICLDPQNLKIRCGLTLDYDWKPSEEMDKIVKNLPKPQRTINFGKKVGRNDPCPCGSGKKYKKCCINLH